MIDTGSNVVYSIRLPFLPATRVENMRNVRPVFGHRLKRITGIGKSTSTVGTLKFYFHFGSKEFSVDLNTIPGATPFIISQKDLASMGLNNQAPCKTIDRREVIRRRLKWEIIFLLLCFQNIPFSQPDN